MTKEKQAHKLPDNPQTLKLDKEPRKLPDEPKAPKRTKLKLDQAKQSDTRWHQRPISECQLLTAELTAGVALNHDAYDESTEHSEGEAHNDSLRHAKSIGVPHQQMCDHTDGDQEACPSED